MGIQSIKLLSHSSSGADSSIFFNTSWPLTIKGKIGRIISLTEGYLSNINNDNFNGRS